MKTLYLVRHAKSSWDNPNLTDIERPLNARGLRDAPFMAKLLKDKGVRPDVILSSPAVRALTTAKFFAKELGYDESKIETRDLIYDRGAKQILYMIAELDDGIESAMLFGHNPDLSALAHFYCEFPNGNLPTAAVVCVDFDVKSWAETLEKKGTLRFYENPKKYFKNKKKKT